MITNDIYPWILFNLFVVIMLMADLFVFHRKAHVVSMKEAVIATLFWISLALAFNLYIYSAQGFETAINFLTGYLIEKSLSVDNLFVFILIFKYFHTPTSSHHKVLFWGVLGAIIMRAIFIATGIALVSSFQWMFYIFGAILIFSGIKLGFEKEKKIIPELNPLVQLFRRFFRVVDRYENDQFFIILKGKTYATLLVIVLIVIETTDIIFAVDSIPAILAITSDPYIVYTSNIFAIMGLRSLYFVLSHLMSLFHYLNYGLSIILVFIGIKMILADFYHIPNMFALLTVFFILSTSIVVSILYPVAKN